MPTERTDPPAAIRAAQYVQRIARDTARDKGIYEDGTVDVETAQEFVPDAIVAGFVVREEHFDGLRRVVLYGAWETDPSAVAATHVPRAAAA